ncbi:aminotransferase [Actinomycetospora endophytica]|uniref:Aminotransferase n=1 Tax=Actinomycetospora endophytica TaxID=2291215 RepID=A0ABS8PBN6_9PSEU|nr:aminotransferase [Actinomycetospora endophytica]MCD2195403.1 aminotransferase [Actinomycetospora endophytica]
MSEALLVRFAARVAAGIDSPVGAAYARLPTRAGRGPLLDLAQAAPAYPPAPEVVEHVTAVAHDPRGAAYAAQAGLGHLREAFAADLVEDYGGGRLESDDVVVTAGCNQAFCLVAATLTEPGDEVVTPRPVYFNHEMWLRMHGVVPVIAEPGPDLVLRAADVEPLITDRTRAVVVVTPGNPTGVVVPPDELAALAALARRHDLALVLDETYRSFRDDPAPPHRLFADPDWRDTVVSLHSFSKDLALPGYRVGAVVGAPELRRDVMKLLDCVAIGAPRIGQEAAWAGLTKARDWRAERAAEVAGRRAAFTTTLAERPGGVEVLTCGGFFAWVRHPFDRPTPDVVADLLTEQDVLVMPGTDFQSRDDGTMRVSVGNLGLEALDDLAERLTTFGSGR